ncbi:MAG: serine/threonine protein kinase, partial [Thiomargarita sp.]|nr:serine/threonine protein kinase [Thiomargarita sp.]
MNKKKSYYNALPTGYRLEQYQIIKVLGAGGFGIAYLADDTRLNTQVVLKEYLPNDISVREQDTSRVLPKDSNSHEDYELGLKEYIKEARTIAKFDHPNIVQVKNYIEANNTAYIVMNYIDGSNLSELAQGETATEAEIRHILLPLLEGLKEVHNQNYLHRDIKLSNIFIQHKSRKPILIDFGAARFNLGIHSKSITSIVTPGYSPYEQYYSKGKQGAWTDIYALGAVLYRLISGHSPLESPARIMAKEENGIDPLVPAVKLGKNKYSRSLLRAIDVALAVKPSQRPQTIQAFKKILLGSKTIENRDEFNVVKKLAKSKKNIEKINKNQATQRSRRITPSTPPKSKLSIFVFLIIVFTVAIGGWWVNY